MIVSPKGDKFATMELDGRIKVLPRSEVHKEDFAEQAEVGQLAISDNKEVV